jgi:hypothetical protein
MTHGAPSARFEIRDALLENTIAECPVSTLDAGVPDLGSIDLDLDGNVYVVDRAGAGRIYKFAPHFSRSP